MEPVHNTRKNLRINIRELLGSSLAITAHVFPVRRLVRGSVFFIQPSPGLPGAAPEDATSLHQTLPVALAIQDDKPLAPGITGYEVPQ